ncbi:MAG: bifunctional riboflavin kinase/FAD synthetase [Polaribacter sp.]|nr:bifunctional riboflavin kinase/FAD synthetase [Polaribacter sp.]MDG1810856.1 bifunctional riboflavin kinase/FAD synthetase [Polaribacter sp.]MDG1994258.1 bifunctional riboflavin kinase/FAD synthetase [Polaribacter sp.]
MEIIHSLSSYIHTEKTVVTIGTFDGVHIGHQKIIDQVVKTAKKSGMKAVLLTFFPHPRMVLQQNVSIELINTIDERAELLSKTGLDYLIIHPFSLEFSRLMALDFVRKILVNQLNTSKLIIGYDHHFGKNREGNLEQLTEYSHLYNFDVEEIPVQDINEVAVSSTKIRKALSEKNIKTANKYLGYNFMLSGNVVNGRQLGGEIGFPTANLNVKEAYKLIPKIGVYVVKSQIEKDIVYGMMNIGFRPTLEGTHQTIEVHFFDFNNDLYGQNLTIEVLYFLRDEQKFDSIEQLISQLKEDKKTALNYLQNNL